MMKKITSLSNPAIIEFSKLSNHKVRFLTGLFSVEGEKALNDILSSDIRIKNIFVTESYENLDDLSKELVIAVSEPVMKKLASSDSAPKVLTVAYQRDIAIEELLEKSRLLLLDGISDPGNLGTIIRSAVAFGIEGILFINNCVDEYNAKVIRSAAGNFFKIPFFHIKNITELAQFTDFQFIMTDLHSDKVFTPDKIILSDKIILTLGSEAAGISQEVLSVTHKNVKIDTIGVESLNVASAGTIIMYEFSKRKFK